LYKNVRDLTEDLQLSTGGHILYLFTDTEIYIENASSFILHAINQNAPVIVIENDRFMSLLKNRLQTVLTEIQMGKLLFINNFDYYFSNKNFHSPTILSNFSQLIEPYSKKDIIAYTWAHVEWGNTEEVYQKLEEFEQLADKNVNSLKSMSVCAYQYDLVPPSLKHSLIRSHEYLITN
jgi:hypothetical protein